MFKYSLKKIFICFWLHWVLVAVHGLSMVASGGSYSLVLVRELLLMAASPAAKRRLWGTKASVAVAHRLSCPVACGVFPDQGSNPCPLPR